METQARENIYDRDSDGYFIETIKYYNSTEPSDDKLRRKEVHIYLTMKKKVLIEEYSYAHSKTEKCYIQTSIFYDKSQKKIKDTWYAEDNLILTEYTYQYQLGVFNRVNYCLKNIVDTIHGEKLYIKYYREKWNFCRQEIYYHGNPPPMINRFKFRDNEDLLKNIYEDTAETGFGFDRAVQYEYQYRKENYK
ncbi:MAG: hypothetical protein H8E98_05930 [Bacteroidetes bacterium]|nr:hypothetical protein [Bacteroidota bacterium]